MAKQTEPLLLKAREAFKKYSKRDFYADRQRQAFIAKYVEQLRLSNTQKQFDYDEILRLSIVALKNVKVGEYEMRKSEYQRIGKKYIKNVTKATKKMKK
jgi:hypothetical protein